MNQLDDNVRKLRQLIDDYCSTRAPSQERLEVSGPHDRHTLWKSDLVHRIKECQLDLYADRTSAHTMRANHLRLWFASFAYVLICALRRLGLAHTRLAQATCGTIRLKLLKIGAQVRVSVRRIKVAMASACPYAEEFALAHARICAAAR